MGAKIGRAVYCAKGTGAGRYAGAKAVRRNGRARKCGKALLPHGASRYAQDGYALPKKWIVVAPGTPFCKIHYKPLFLICQTNVYKKSKENFGNAEGYAKRDYRSARLRKVLRKQVLDSPGRRKNSAASGIIVPPAGGKITRRRVWRSTGFRKNKGKSGNPFQTVAKFLEIG